LTQAKLFPWEKHQHISIDLVGRAF